MGAAERWRGRAATLEAMTLLVLARTLVAKVAFARWRKWLGASVPPEPSDPALRLGENLVGRRLARAVDRGAARLPGKSLCLPRAMALQWMLGRRHVAATLHIGVRPGHARGSLGDLHAWVVRHGEVLIGASELAHHPIYAARPAQSVQFTLEKRVDPV